MASHSETSLLQAYKTATKPFQSNPLKSKIIRRYARSQLMLFTRTALVDGIEWAVAEGGGDRNGKPPRKAKQRVVDELLDAMDSLHGCDKPAKKAKTVKKAKKAKTAKTAKKAKKATTANSGGNRVAGASVGLVVLALLAMLVRKRSATEKLTGAENPHPDGLAGSNEI